MLNQPELSVVISCYYEEKTVEEFHRRLSATLKSMGVSYEIVFVNDGSKDATFEKLRVLFAEHADVACIVDLFRNSGQAGGLTAGICEAQGKNFVFIDSDLQLDPEELPKLYAEFLKGTDAVTGIRAVRHDSMRRRLFSRFANWLLNTSSGLKLSDYGCTFKIFRGELIRAFDLGPCKIWSPIQSMAKAGSIVEVPVSHHPRRVGKSGWSFLALFDFFVSSLIGISRRIFQLLALIAFGLAGLFFVRLVLAFLVDVELVDRITNGLLLYTFLIVSFSMVALILLLGEYLLRLYISDQKIPTFIVKTRLKKAGN